jgi:hypothetical protein
LFGFCGEGGFEVVLLGFGVDFGGGDFFRRGSDEAEFADSEAVFCAEGWTKDAAGHGAGGVEIAESGGGIEDGAGLVVGVVFELGGTILVDEAGNCVARKIGSKTGDGLPSAGSDGGGALWVGGVESGKAFAEAGSVELRDGENADAALGASWSALEPGAGAAGRVGYRGIDDLDEVRVAGGKRHAVRIALAGNEEFVILKSYPGCKQVFGRIFRMRGRGTNPDAVAGYPRNLGSKRAAWLEMHS